MTIHWANSTNSMSAADAMAAVERALEGADDPTVPDGIDPQLIELARGDPYLAENLVAAHETWAVDQHAIVVSHRPALGWAINRFQQLMRRATWWYAAPQWEQANAFHGAVLRVLTSLVKGQHTLQQQLDDVTGGHVLERTALLEQQIRSLREEQLAFQARIAALEAHLGEKEGLGVRG